MKLIKRAAQYANCRIQSVTAEVLLLARFVPLSSVLYFLFHHFFLRRAQFHHELCRILSHDKHYRMISTFLVWTRIFVGFLTSGFMASWLRFFSMLALSCDDNLLPSKSEAYRLQNKIPKSKIFFFEKHGHSLLLVSYSRLYQIAVYLVHWKEQVVHLKGTMLMIFIPNFRSMVSMSHPSSNVLVSTAIRGAIIGFSTTSHRPQPS